MAWLAKSATETGLRSGFAVQGEAGSGSPPVLAVTDDDDRNDGLCARLELVVVVAVAGLAAALVIIIVARTCSATCIARWTACSATRRS